MWIQSGYNMVTFGYYMVTKTGKTVTNCNKCYKVVTNTYN